MTRKQFPSQIRAAKERRTGSMLPESVIREMVEGRPSLDWMQRRWYEVALAVRARDRAATVAALQAIYDISPVDQVEELADRYLAGSRP